MKLSDFKKLKLTLDQFAQFIESDMGLVEHWRDTRGCEGHLKDDIKSYVQEYAGEHHGTKSDIMYWLLVEMNVIDPDSDACERIQNLVDRTA